MKILIMTPSLHEHDAVGNDVLQQYYSLGEKGWESYIYAELADEPISHLTADISAVDEIILDPDNVIIYHHCVFWRQGEEIVNRTKAKLIMKYHCITPSVFFEKYNIDYVNATKPGIEQTERFVKSGKFRRFIGASEFNNRDLELYSALKSDLSTLAPFHKIEDFGHAGINVRLKEELSNGGLNVLFVGRVVPNKGHKHLIATIREYVNRYDRNIHLNIIGYIDPGLNGYYVELNELITENGLSKVISFRQGVSLQDLHTFYSYSSIFLLMSDHEGFCVPILEAQYHKMPIIALDRCAVKETLGDEQIIIDEPDYELFAAAIHIIGKDETIRQYLVERGYDNFKKYQNRILSDKLAEKIKKLC